MGLCRIIKQTWLAAAALLWAISPTPILATDFYWNDSNGGSFTESTNWNLSDGTPANGPGGASDTINFDLNVLAENRYTVTNVTGQNSSLLVHNDSLQLEFTNYELLSNNFSMPSLVVGVANGDSADVILKGNGSSLLQTEEISIGLNGTTAIVTVDNLQWTSDFANDLDIGSGGTLKIINGSVVSTAINNVDGTVIVDGVNSRWNCQFGPEIGSGMLTIINGGMASGFVARIGRNADSIGTVIVDGVGSKWNVTSLEVGSSGSGTLTVTNGGSVSGTFDEIGYSAGSTGTVTVDGVGSMLTSSRLYIGDSGSGTLNITNGAVASTGSSFGSTIGNSSGSMGIVNVSGIGSRWDAHTLNVGNSGSGTLNITNGGVVTTVDGGGFGSTTLIGSNTGSTGMVTVSGSGSRWNASSLKVGGNGTGTLNIVNDGLVDVSGNTFLSNGGGQGSINFDNGTLATKTLLLSSFDQLIGTGIINTNGLVTNGDLSFDLTHGVQREIILNSQPGQNVTVNLEVNGTGDLGAGYSGSGMLEIAEGLNVTSKSGFLGYLAGSTGTATVSGTNSTWTNTSSLFVGNSGNGTLNIDAGGTATSQTGYVGYNQGSTGSATVSGANSTWTNTSSLFVGNSGNGTLNINTGGSATSQTGYVGYNQGSTGLATVSGTNSTWTNSSSLFVGYSGTGTLNINSGGTVSSLQSMYVGFSLGMGSLNVTSGGSANSQNSYIGVNANSTGTVLVDGSGSVWTTSSNLEVGSNGSGSLIVSGTGTVFSQTGWIGNNSGSTGTVTVDGNGSSWSSGALLVGEEGAGTLHITNGGLVDVSGQTSLGNGGSIHLDNGTLTTKSLLLSNFNSLTGTGIINTKGLVTDGNFNFDQSHGVHRQILLNGQPNQNVTIDLNVNGTGDLGAGYNGQGTLTIAEGVSVTSNVGYLGYLPGSTGTATVTGVNSMWTNNSSLFVGDRGNGTLNINAGGAVVSQVGTLGSGGGTGAVNISGNGTLWNASLINIRKGMLSISNGGTVITTDSSASTVGNAFGLTGETTVNGVGSQWNSSAELIVGNSGTGSLLVTEGGTVSSTRGSIGVSSSGSGSVVVEGPGSRWDINSTIADLGIGGRAGGFSGVGNGSLTIAPGAKVSVGRNTRIFTNGSLNLAGGAFDTSSISIQGNGQFNWMGGTLSVDTYNGNLTNSNGTLAPGNSPGITTVMGNYTQLAGGTLEIEVASYSGTMGMPAWVPGTDHDQLRVTGTATLGGRLEIPIIDPLKSAGGPTTGLPPIDFITAASVVGEFSAVVAPGLSPNLAVDIEYLTTGPKQGARLSFVPLKTNIAFDEDTNNTADWFDSNNTWEDTANPGTPVIPTLLHDVTIQNLVPGTQEVQIEAANAFVAKLTVGGAGTDELVVRVGNGTASATAGNLSSTTGVSVVENGVIALNQGTLATTDVMIDGGMLKGNGLVDLAGESIASSGKLMVTAGAISPGFSPGGMNSVIGHLDIDGDLELEVGGEFMVEAESETMRDTIAVTGEAILEGTLTLDLTGSTVQAGDSIQILTAESIAGVFSDLEILNGDGLYSVLRTEVLPSGLIALSMDQEKVGDPTGNGKVDSEDVSLFALALRKYELYEDDPRAPDPLSAFYAIDANEDGLLDFDDIGAFADLMDVPPQLLIQMINQVYSVPEPGSLWLANFLVLSLAIGARAYKR